MSAFIVDRTHVRTITGYLLAFGAVAAWFAPMLDDRGRTVVALGLMCLSSLVSPRRERSNVDQPPPILWRDRDAGQQFTIVMFYVLMLLLVSYLAFQIASEVDGFVGDALAAAIMCAGAWITLRNWKNRNARR